MPISTECPSCRARFRVREEHAGKRGRCPHCKAPFTVPPARPADDGSDLVPLDDPPRPAPAPEPGLVPLAPEPRPAARGGGGDDEEEANAGYVLAGGAARKAKGVRVREGSAPGVFASAEGVKEAAAATRRARTPGEILAAFGDAIEPVRPSGMYALWALIVTAFMLLLPLVYVALIGLIGYGMYYHAVYDVGVFRHAGGNAGGAKFAFLVYVTPLIAGGVMVAFLLKPLFARSGKGAKERELDPSVEPLLFAFIDGVCATVGAPRPARVMVNTEVNASAGYTGGPFAVFTREPVLTIGLGMVVGLSLKQFAGVMAHELGHISQSTGNRLVQIIESINSWFIRVVFERDEWDETIERWSTDGNGYTILLGGLARLAVWLARRVLWVLLYAGRFVSLTFVRQQEYDADRYEARMVGGQTFARTAWRLRELGLASQFAMSDLRASWQQRRLPDNFPKLILANVPQIPKEVLAEYRKAMGQARTGRFDTHPCDRDRIASAKVEEPGAGIFNLDGPATDVFRNFDSLARAASFDYYRALLGGQINKEQLFPVAELVESQAVAQEGYVAADRFFLNALNYAHRLPLPWDHPKAPAEPKAARGALARARDDLRAARAGYFALNERFGEAQGRLYKAETAQTLLKAGVKFKPGAFDLPKATPRAAESAREEATAELRRLEGELGPFLSAAARRVTGALAILQADPVADRVPDGRDRREEARTLYPCVAHLGANVIPAVDAVVRARSMLGGMLQLYSEKNNSKNPAFTNAVLRASGALRERLEEFRWKVGDTIYYPFEHAQEDITLARFALPALLPETNDVGALIDVAGDAVDKVLGLYRRALGRLAVTAEEVERVLGLEPIAVDGDDPAGA